MFTAKNSVNVNYHTAMTSLQRGRGFKVEILLIISVDDNFIPGFSDCCQSSVLTNDFQT